MKLERLWKRMERNAAGREILALTGRIGQNRIAANAAGLVFYLFISMIPLFILLCSVLPFTGISADALTAAINHVTPEVVHGLIGSLIGEAYAVRISVFSTSCIFLLWAAAKLMKALIGVLDAVYGKTGQRGYFAVVARSLLYTLGFLAAFGAVLVVYVKGHTLEEIVGMTSALQQFFGRWANVGKYLVSIALLTLVFALIYKLAPAGKRKYARQIPGAAAAAVGVSVFTFFFSLYGSGSNLYNSFYGSLASVALFLLWMYTCIQIFLIGGVVNHHLEEKTGNRQ